MAREYYYDVGIRQKADGNVELLANLRVTVYLAGTLTLASVFQARTGGTAQTNPQITGADGYAGFWADPGAYDVKWEDTQVPARIATRVVGFQTDVIPDTITATEIAPGAVTATELATAVVNQLVPTGAMMPFAGSTAPTSWILCDGSVVTTGVSTALRSLLQAAGSPYGTSGADPRVPDTRSRSLMGAGAGTGLTVRTLGQTVGVETQALSTANLPAHSHGITDPGHGHSASEWSILAAGTGPTTTIIGSSSGGANLGVRNDFIQSGGTGITTTQNTGSGTASNVVHPVIAINHIIKL